MMPVAAQKSGLALLGFCMLASYLHGSCIAEPFCIAHDLAPDLLGPIHEPDALELQLAHTELDTSFPM